MPALLRRAAVVAYPALEEGFGLPALEALACGAPLVTTEGTAMAEVAGGRRCWYLRGTSRRWPAHSGRPSRAGAATERRALGLTVAGEHTWEASVARHLHAYAVARGGPAVGFRGCAR